MLCAAIFYTEDQDSPSEPFLIEIVGDNLFAAEIEAALLKYAASASKEELDGEDVTPFLERHAGWGKYEISFRYNDTGGVSNLHLYVSEARSF